MLDINDREIGVAGKSAEQLGKSFKTAGRCAHADHHEFGARLPRRITITLRRGFAFGALILGKIG